MSELVTKPAFECRGKVGPKRSTRRPIGLTFLIERDNRPGRCRNCLKDPRTKLGNEHAALARQLQLSKPAISTGSSPSHLRLIIDLRPRTSGTIIGSSSADSIGINACARRLDLPLAATESMALNGRLAPRCGAGRKR